MASSHLFIHQGLRTSLAQHQITPQPALRQQGFGGHFKDAPPPFIEETKADNKIERRKKPKEKKKKKKTKKEKEEIKEAKPISNRKIIKD
jgi:hypothetical protein